MNTTLITESTLEVLARFDTAPRCNALEILRPSYRDKGYTRRPLVAARPGLAPVIDIARGGSIHAEAPSQEPVPDRPSWYEYVANAELPTVVVIEDCDTGSLTLI